MEGSIAELAGAKVIFMTSNGPKNNFGHAEKSRITALAIGEYLGAPGDIFVFACDRHWQVVGDLLYSSIEDAKKAAESNYEVSLSARKQPTQHGASAGESGRCAYTLPLKANVMSMANNLKKSTFLGTCLAPLTAPIIYVVAVFAFTSDLTPKIERTSEAALVAFAVFIPGSYIMSYALGVPVAYFLKRFNKYLLVHLVMCSALAGAVAISILTLIAYSAGATVNWRSIEFVI